MCALRHAERGELLGVLGVADIDNGCSVRAAHMRHVRDVVLDHDLSAAGAIEVTDLANADTGPHDELPRLTMMKLTPRMLAALPRAGRRYGRRQRAARGRSCRQSRPQSRTASRARARARTCRPGYGV